MANSYYSISVTNTTIAEIKNALESKYGAGIIVHFQDSNNIIFSCTALSNKVQRIYYSYNRLFFYYGDAWTSGATITNQNPWAGYNHGACEYIDMILGDNTFFICANQGSALKGILIIMGKLTNDKYALFSAVASTYYASSYLAKNTIDNVDLFPICFSEGFAAANGKLYKQPLILQRLDGKVEINNDGSIASFRDIYNCSHALPNTDSLVGTNYLMSAANIYTGPGMKQLYTSMIAEF